MSKSSKSGRRFWKDWKIGGKVIGIVLTISLVSISVLLAVNYAMNVQQTTQDVGEQLLTIGDQVVLRAADQVFNELTVLETLARTPLVVEEVKKANAQRADLTEAEISSLDQAWIDEKSSIAAEVKQIQSNDVTAYLKEFIAQNPDEIEVFATDENGLIVAMTDRTSDFLQADEGWWQSAYAEGKGNPYIASVEFDESSKAYAMNLGVPIFDPQTGIVIGILRGTLDVSALIETFGTVKVGETGTASLIDSEGNILFNTNSDLIMTTADAEIMALFETGQSGWTKGNNLGGTPSIMAYSQLAGEQGEKLNWYILTAQNQDEVNKTILRNLLISLLAGLSVIVVGVFLALLMIRLITKPMAMITNIFNLLATGDLKLDEKEMAYQIGRAHV